MAPGPARTLAIVGILASLALVVLDAAIANVALPSIAEALQIPAARSIWVVTAYQTALVMALLPCAALGESIGLRRVFLSGCGLFMLASLLCAMAPSLPLLAAARFLQGLGGAAIMALAAALLRHVVGSARIGRAIGWNAVTVALCTASGPTLGAFILSLAGWHWLFAVNLPVGALALLAARRLPPAMGTRRRVDLGAALLNASGFAGLVLGAELLPARPWPGAILLGAAFLAFALLVARERGRPAPLVPLDLLARPAFRLAVTASVCCFMGQAAALVALPFHLQHGLGLSPLRTGLVITPWPLTVALMTPVTARLAERLSTARLCALGGLCLAAGLAGAALMSAAQGPVPLALCVALCGFGFGLFQVPNNRTMLLAAPIARSGAAGGMQGTARLTGQTLGAVAMTLIFMTAGPALAPRLGFAFGAVFTLAAAVVSLLRARAADPAQPMDAACRP
jgi:DHA2 family multidrug resistance protein-like MFS transporter